MLKSLNKNKKGIYIMVVSSLCVALGQLSWKLSYTHNLFLFLGFFLYGIGALLMTVAYKYGSLSVLQPTLSINYILSLILGYLVFNEAITKEKVISILLVLFGVVLLGIGDA